MESLFSIFKLISIITELFLFVSLVPILFDIILYPFKVILKLDHKKITINSIQERIFKTFCKFNIKFITPLFVFGLFSIIISSPVVKEKLGIYDITQMPEGTYCYYVEISDDSHKYTLPAEIIIIKEKSYDEEGDVDIYTNYYVNRVYFTNGGYLYFDDDEPVYKINQKYSSYDQNEKFWNYKILNKHAYSPYVNETKLGNKPKIILALNVIGCLIVIFSLLFYKKEQQNQ